MIHQKIKEANYELRLYSQEMILFMLLSGKDPYIDAIGLMIGFKVIHGLKN